jgi:hypothetical protein
MMASMLLRRLAVLIWMITTALAWSGDASACGAFAGPKSEGELAESLPFLTVEQVLLLWDKETGVEDFIRETRFDRTGKPFGFVIPTPSRPEVSAAKPPFDALRSKYGFDSPFHLKIGGGAGPVQGSGGRGGAPEAAVLVLSKQRIGSFVAFTLSAKEPGAFDAWLRKNGFAMRSGAKPWIRHYVDLGFFFVALRYDAPPGARGDAGTASMTSETVRIRFRTPNPYYPYMEPAHETGDPGPDRRMLTGWLVTREPMKPVAFHPTGDSTRAWQRPWHEGWRYQASSAALAESLDGELRALLPAAEQLEIQTFRDLKVSREGYGDVLFVAERPESPAASGAVLAERRRLLGAVDPTLLSVGPDGGLEDDRPTLQRDLDAGEATDAADAAAAAPATQRAPRGCSFAPPLFGARSSWVSVWLVVVAVGIGRRRRSESARWTKTTTSKVVLTALLFVGCRSRDTSARSDAQVEHVEPPSALPDAATRPRRQDGATSRADREQEALAILSGANAPNGILDPERERSSRGLADLERKGEVVIGEIQPGETPIADAARVTASLRTRFLQCYDTARATEPKLAGTLRIKVDVTPIGEVGGATVTANQGLSASVATCCGNVLRRAAFSEPKVPASFVFVLTFRPPK